MFTSYAIVQSERERERQTSATRLIAIRIRVEIELVFTRVRKFDYFRERVMSRIKIKLKLIGNNSRAADSRVFFSVTVEPSHSRRSKNWNVLATGRDSVGCTETNARKAANASLQFSSVNLWPTVKKKKREPPLVRA